MITYVVLNRKGEIKLFLQSKQRQIRPNHDLTYGNTINLEMFHCRSGIDESKLAFTGSWFKDLFIALSEGELLIERL